MDQLFGDPILRKRVLDYRQFLKLRGPFSERALFEKILILYLEEAELTLSLIKDMNFTRNESLLEIGAGLGFVYGFLKKQGLDIYGIEPSESGFDGSAQAAIQIFKIIDVDGSHFYPFSARECAKLHTQFDIIFSNNVLEHIPEIEQSFSAMKRVLKPHGVMVHNTVNYLVPYEPHFKILLFPLFPRLTGFFSQVLRKSPLWNSLNFITTRKLKEIGRLHHLKTEFKRDQLQKTFLRFDTDPEFSERHRYFGLFYRILRWTRVIKLMDKIPIALTTPIAFTMRNMKEPIL